jgi:uncharacterized protein (TIRG00374 family)
MNARAKKWIKFTLRWGIAVGGIAWVVANISLRDRVMVLNPSDNRPVPVNLAEQDEEDSQSYLITDPVTGEDRRVSATDVLVKADRDHVNVLINGQQKKVNLLAIAAPMRIERGYHPNKLLIEDPATRKGVWIDPSEVIGGYQVKIPYPRVEPGILSMVRRADPMMLWAAVFIFPITFIVTSLRWHALLKALEINMSLGRAFVLNMVGAFYNTFMPGSTGGDLLKAYYASKFTVHRTRAVMSVIIDRVIGLLALVILGGTMAAYQWDNAECLQVAVISGALMASVCLGLFVFYTPILRKFTGLDFVIQRLPMQKQVQNAIATMNIYRERPLLILWAIIVTFPVHITVILSVAFAGKAFGLPLNFMYYWVVVPVIVLVGSMPISPQGAGVMEFFAVKLTETHGATVSQAVVMTMSLRIVQIFWNLWGGFFVLKGNFHVPTPSEQQSIEEESEKVQGTMPRMDTAGSVIPSTEPAP